MRREPFVPEPPPVKVLDATDHQLIALLQDNARLSTVALAKTVGLSRSAVQERLQRLEAAGILRITRRLVREVIHGGGFPLTVCRQGSNLYAVFEPGEHAERLPVRATAPQQFPGAMFAALVKTMGWRPSLPNRAKNTNLVFSKERQAREAPLYGQNSPEVCF